MRAALLILLIVTSLLLQGQNPRGLEDATKLIVVTNADWNAVDGTMMRFERKGKSWKKVGRPITIVVGKNGMAWDPSFSSKSDGALLKHEGDGRSPAGVFPITAAFGFAPKITNNNFYIPITPTTECVDDVQSKYYNRIVDRLTTKDVDWNSSEKMRQVAGYRYGAVVGYNEAPRAGDGSCIFLHIWSGPGRGTAGCTAMPEAEAQALLPWFDERTVLVQMPKADYERVKASLQLP